MNDDFEAFRKRLEIELQNEFRVRMIVKCVLEYFKYSKHTVFKGTSRNAVYIRSLIYYITFSIYGVSPSFTARKLKVTREKICIGNERIREILNDVRTHTDVNNLRQILVKILNANHA